MNQVKKAIVIFYLSLWLYLLLYFNLVTEAVFRV